jgi:hypothetical protein
MIMPPRLRKFVLTAHVTSSVGWLGAVVAYLALAVVTRTSQDAQMVRAAFLVLEPIYWFVLVPLALASLLIGIVNALGTPWGLFRHYWVLFKFLLTVFATIILLQYTQTISHLAEVAATSADPRELPGSLLHSGGALLVLLIITVLSVYKPQGMTPYGWRKQKEESRKRHEQRAVSQP